MGDRPISLDVRRISARAADQDGFTIVEVLVAAVILLIGMAGVLAMLNQANATTTSNKAREGATALQRELVETVRGIPYDQLAAESIVADVRATAGFSSSHLTPTGWTMVRRGVTYKVAVGVCTVDDPADGVGSHAGGQFCATGVGAASAETCRSALGIGGGVNGTGTAAGATVGDCGIDLNFDGLVDNLTEAQAGVAAPAQTSPADTDANDYKRIVTLVRWDRGAGARYGLQSSIVPNPGLSAAPHVTKLEATSPATTEAQFPLTITDPAQTSVAMAVTTNRPAAAVSWYVGGTPSGAASGTTPGTAWSFTWPLGAVDASAASPASAEVLDGTYDLSAKAFDEYGSGGPDRWVQITLNRRAPFAPAGLIAARIVNDAQLVWAMSPERDVVGYRVVRSVTGLQDVTVCDTENTVRACTDASAPASGTARYTVTAIDRAPDGPVRAGQPATADLSFDGAPPAAPADLAVSRSSSGATVTWTASTTSGVSYQVYRDGVTLADRFGSPTSSTSFTDSDTTSGQHTYSVAAVSGAAESAKTPGVTG